MQLCWSSQVEIRHLYCIVIYVFIYNLSMFDLHVEIKWFLFAVSKGVGKPFSRWGLMPNSLLLFLSWVKAQLRLLIVSMVKMTFCGILWHCPLPSANDCLRPGCSMLYLFCYHRTSESSFGLVLLFLCRLAIAIKQKQYAILARHMTSSAFCMSTCIHYSLDMSLRSVVCLHIAYHWSHHDHNC